MLSSESVYQPQRPFHPNSVIDGKWYRLTRIYIHLRLKEGIESGVGGNSAWAPTESNPLSTRIITALARHKGVAADELDVPLHTCIDVDALDSLFAPLANGSARPEGCLTFTVDDCTVTVTADGDIAIADA